MNISNSSRFYIFDSEFAQNCSSQNINADRANTLRTHIHQHVRWARDYRSAVYSVLNFPNKHDPNSPTPLKEFADVSRINDGPIVGEQVSAPDIAALVYTPGQQDSGKRAVVTYPVNSQIQSHVSFPYGAQHMRHYNSLSCSFTVEQVGAKVALGKYPQRNQEP